MTKSLLVFFLSIDLFAHPHFFIDVDLDIKDKEIEHSWKFDKINSKLLLFEFDKNRDKKFDKEETKNFYLANIETLKENNFNLFIETNGEEQRFDKLDNFKVQYLKRRIDVSFSTKVNLTQDLTFCSIDPIIYMAYKLNNINTKLKTQIQKSEYDFCIGVSK